MFKIVEKKSLNPTVSKITVEAPLIAKKAEPGQFIIFRAKEDSERIPLTIADFDREAGTVTIIYQIVGAGTMELDTFIGHLQRFGNTQTQIVFSTPVEPRGLNVEALEEKEE